MAELHQIYNSRILKAYILCLDELYPQVDTDMLLTFAGVTRHELEDPGHWFSQQQVDRFFTSVIEITGDTDIARKAGRFVVLRETAGPLRQLALGLLKVSSIYLLMPRLYPMLSRGACVQTQKISANKVRIIIEPFAHVQESLHQCENRKGIFEALSTLFAEDYAHVEHPACVHRGDPHCVYMVGWREPPHARWRRLTGLSAVFTVLCSGFGFFTLQLSPWLLVTLAGVIFTMGLCMRACFLKNRFLTHIIQKQGNVAEDHIKEINYRYQGALLVQKIGQATSAILNVDRLSAVVLENIQHYLDFDRGLIMLADEKRSRLVYSAGYGFDQEMAELLSRTRFRSDNPTASGVFIQAFLEKRPILVDDIDMCSDGCSFQSQEFIRQIGSKSLICLPIVHEDQSLGILVVDNLITKRPLTLSDMNLLMAVAYQAAVGIVSAKAYEDLKSSEKRYRSLYENAPTAYISLCIEDGRMVNCNSAAVRLLGRPREELMGASLWQYVVDDRQCHEKARWMRRQLQRGRTVSNEAIGLAHRDGHTLWVNVTLDPFRDASGQIMEGRCILVDTTHQKQLEDQLRNAQRMEAIGTLAGGVAHDLSNILSALVSYPDLLLMDVATDNPMYEPLVKIKGAGKRAVSIVQDLLTLSRRGMMVNEVVAINRVIEDYLSSPEHDYLTGSHPDIGVDADLAPDVPAIKGSPICLTKALMNVVLNAFEAMPDGGRVRISTRKRTVGDEVAHPDGKSCDYAVVRVVDDGHGIAEQDLSRVFDPFFSRKKIGRSGTGLGMAIVWAAVQDLNGTIDIQSEIGRGTRVEMRFPATVEKQAVGPPPDREKEELSGAGEKILVVDDNAEHREIATRMLNRLGYETIAVENAQAVMTKLAVGYKPDLIILDMMPEQDLDGLSAYRRILAFYPDQKAILAGGVAQAIRVRKALELGAEAYVHKPYSIRELGAAIRYVLGNE